MGGVYDVSDLGLVFTGLMLVGVYGCLCLSCVCMLRVAAVGWWLVC